MRGSKRALVLAKIWISSLIMNVVLQIFTPPYGGWNSNGKV